MLEMNENKIYDAIEPEKKPEAGFEVSNTLGLKNLAGSFVGVEKALDHDADLTPGDIRDLEFSLQELVVNVEGDDISLERLLGMSHFEDDKIIWEQIRNGNSTFSLDQLTFLPSHIAQILQLNLENPEDFSFGIGLHFDRITRLSDESVRHITKIQTLLVLPELTHLSSQASHYFSSHEGGASFDKLEVTAEIARNLAKMGGDLGFGESTVLSHEVLKILAGHEGVLDLAFVDDLADDVAEAFRGHTGTLYFDGLTNISEKVAECLATNNGQLSLLRITEITDEIAEKLSHHTRDTLVIGLTALSDKSSEYLANHVGSLSLEELREISDVQIKNLSKHRGRLELGIYTLSDKAAEYLSQHSGCLSLLSLVDISDTAAKFLSNNQDITYGSGKVNEKILKFRRPRGDFTR